jgi:hypothetical protein
MNQRRLIVGLLSPPPTFLPTPKATRTYEALATASRATKRSAQRHFARRYGHLDQIALCRLVQTPDTITGATPAPRLCSDLQIIRSGSLGARRGLRFTRLVVAAHAGRFIGAPS